MVVVDVVDLVVSYVNFYNLQYYNNYIPVIKVENVLWIHPAVVFEILLSHAYNLSCSG